ncbi:MAG TPA: enoyl-CoA hydratase-related protein [Candidatus Thalassarchaeaceae archaeon]|nr:enoyl-CoA hydratase-related protein [Candidatus Thalassarchaeaceae archaeon]
MMSDEIPETELCRLEVDGPVAKITLDRTEAHNALNVQLITELIELLKWTSKRSVGRTGELRDRQGNQFLRVLLMVSEGKHFCAGADINMMKEGGGKSPKENREDAERLDGLFHGLWSHPCFTIACVQGAALGGGAGMVACVDHSIGGPRTQIALSEAKLGISAAVIGPYVYRRLGSAHFRRLAMRASRVESDEALRIGFIDELVDSQESMSTSAKSVISDVLTSGPMAVTSAKKMVADLDEWDGTKESLRLWTLDLTSEMRGSPEGQEGLSAFIEGRKPAWFPEDRDGKL